MRPEILITADMYETPMRRLCNGFYQIVNKHGNQVPFRANGSQIKLLENLHTLNLLLKARQWGGSTVIDILGLDQAIWNENFAVGIIAHTLEDVKKLFRTKVKFPWDHLHADFRNKIGARLDAANEIVFKHGSSVVVGTSLRSSTTQYLHISEYGKICAQFPHKAREIRTGALNTLHPGNLGFIESTAEGRAGDFFEKCMTAIKKEQAGKTLSVMDWKFHFVPWYLDPDCTLGKADTLATLIDETMRKYFNQLREEHGIELTAGQEAWYANKADEQRSDMRREFPSFPMEAFEVAIEGAYYARQMAKVRRGGQITAVPHDPRYPVHTAWDIGRRDTNGIWFFQDGPAGTFRMIRYYENNGEAMQHYGHYMQDIANNTDGWYYGTCYLPHDAAKVDYTREDGKSCTAVLEDMGFRVECINAVDTNAEHGEGVQAVRDVLPLCWFDEEKCSGRPRAGDHDPHTGGIEALDHFQKKWDEKQGAFKDTYWHNWASDGAKAFETFARGHVYKGPGRAKKRKPRTARSWKSA